MANEYPNEVVKLLVEIKEIIEEKFGSSDSEETEA